MLRKFGTILPTFIRTGSIYHFFINCRKLASYFKKSLKIQLKARSERQTQFLKLTELKLKDKIKIKFIAYKVSQWKLSQLIDEFKKMDRFEVEILVYPDKSLNTWSADYEYAKSYFKNKYRGTVPIYTLETENREDIADIVFFTKPIDDGRSGTISNYPNSLKCYIPYSAYCDNNPQLQYNKIFHSKLWRHYVPTKYHYNYGLRYGARKDNLKKTGLITHCALTNPSRSDIIKSNSLWARAKNRKKVIWAPHHTIKESTIHTNHSTFMLYCDYFLSLASSLEEQIFIIFKPHPNLRHELNKVWGTERTNKYFDIWNGLANGYVYEGPYVPLFHGSDCMIHDSVSFMAEYLLMHKPVGYLQKKTKTRRNFINSFGEKCLEFHTLLENEDQIRQFIFDENNSQFDTHYSAFVQELSGGGSNVEKTIVNDILDRL